MKQVMGLLIEEPLKLWELNIYLSRPEQRRTEKINIIADDNHLE